MVARLRDNADALSFPIPAWFTPDFVRAVQARLRSLLGRFRATPHGSAMVLTWGDGSAAVPDDAPRSRVGG